MHETVPFLSPLLPAQLAIRVARRFGQGPQVLEFLIKKLSAHDSQHEVFAGYEPTDHDVFVTCFSKSGTNWAMQMVTQTAHRGAAQFEHIHQVVPWPGAKFPGIVALDDPGPAAASPTGLRGIKTSFAAEHVPYSPAAKYLCVARDPKEIVVSAYHFLTGVFGLREHVSWAQWYELGSRPGGFILSWAAHMASYWAWRERPNVRVLFYADMVADLDSAVDEVAGLLGVELADDERAEVIRRCGFEHMKAHESQFAPPRLPLLTGSKRGKMMRQGKSGRSSELLTEAQRAEIDQRMLDELARLGSDFPYAERFMACKPNQST